ncbi:AGAMOUS-like 62 [Hibiscus trionum]|uniref:AGAMOUS-like 62 n=1 Tax=Hibiscus trionum TaxID=183268 RepID=A0A9W7LXC0_HIBTR|nr:AGAMOUS-like 62 [Hibiscus trionum]
MASSGKKTKGRQKIEMKVIEKEDDKLITFSKRRSGIYKKISEITTLCGTDILFICFSPAGKLYSFGHPSVESVANRFLNNNILPSDDNTHLLVEAYRKEKINEIIRYYNEVIGKLDATKGKQKILAQQASGSETNLWWEAPIEQLNLQELEELESRYTKHLNELYNTRSKKIAASINPNEDSL